MSTDTNAAAPGGAEPQTTLANRMVVAIDNLRLLMKEYELQTPEVQKSVRHHLYQKTGKFGRDAVVPMIGKFKEIEDELINKGRA